MFCAWTFDYGLFVTSQRTGIVVLTPVTFSLCLAFVGHTGCQTPMHIALWAFHTRVT